MTRDGLQWKRDFPMTEEVEDFSGKIRRFLISCHEGALGFTVRAEENGTEGNGYQFGVYSETSPYAAFGRLRDKMRRALATRHLSGSAGSPQMMHDTLRGRITSDGDRGVLFVVDGIPLELDKFAGMLASLEGWEFELQIKSALE
ncbi:MAG: hypothetical protein SGI90_00835 [Candidatus Eisenbacteria bacterium]|nr:hypothetical protein [Candidatus Eisenbacteria bacterium]